jgi:hypothetical protein
MSNRKPKGRRAMPARNPTAAEQEAALEHLLYEMLILASALVFRDKRYLFSFFDGLNWGVPQVAQDVIRLKSRLLLDFFEGPANPHPEDMLLGHFSSVAAEQLSAKDAQLLSGLKSAKDKIHKGTVHLSWARTKTQPPTSADRLEMDEAAIFLLGRANNFVKRSVASGLHLGKNATAYSANVDRLLKILQATPRMDERTAKRPPPDKRINIEELS